MSDNLGYCLNKECEEREEGCMGDCWREQECEDSQCEIEDCEGECAQFSYPSVPIDIIVSPKTFN